MLKNLCLEEQLPCPHKSKPTTNMTALLPPRRPASEQLSVSCYCQGSILATPRGCSAHLGMLEDVHDEDGEAQAEDVGSEAGVEVGMGILLQASRKAEGRG